MSKEVVTEENYKRIVLRRMITLCWIFLFACFIIKIFGGNFFRFIGESDAVEFIAQHWLLLTAVQFVFYTIQSYLYLNIMLKDKYNKFVISGTILVFITKCLTDFSSVFIVISFICEAIFLFVLPVVLGQKWYKPILFMILLLVFQSLSMFIKEVTLLSFINADVVAFVYMIDYYIMLVLTYLYAKLGGNFMKFGFFFLSKDKAQLEAYKNVVIKKHIAESDKLKDKHSKELAKIDAKIAKAK